MNHILKNMANSTFWFESINQDINLCIVDIPEFIGQYFKGIFKQNYTISKNIVFNQIDLKDIFSFAEINQINSFKTLKKQIEWICGRFSIKNLVSTKTSSLYPDITISYQKQGAPYLDSFPEFNISISHAGKYAVGAISFYKKCDLGIDIEKIKKIDIKNFIKVAFSDKENKTIENKKVATIFRYWTIKEAYIKYIKKGFNENLKKVEIFNNRIFYYNKIVDNIDIISKNIDQDHILTTVFDKQKKALCKHIHRTF